MKKKIVQARPITPSKAAKKPIQAKKTKAVPIRKALPTPKKSEDDNNNKRRKITDVDKIKKKPTQKIKEKPIQAKVEEKTKVAKKMVKAEVPYKYNSRGRPDPFRPFMREVKAIPISKRARKRPLTPLERAELSQFKVVAILASGNDKRAMVEDGTGKGFIIRIGTYIGKKEGQVTNIFADHFVVEEKFVDIYGQTNTRRHAVKLRTSSGAGGRR